MFDSLPNVWCGTSDFLHRKGHVLVLLILAGLLVGGCELISLEEKSSAEVKPLAAELPASGPEVLDATDRFSWKLARELQKADPDENLFFSPLSISIALGMTMNGAGGETRAEMKKTLGFEGQSLSKVNDVYRTLITTLTEVDPQVDLSLAQAIYYDEKFPFRQTFLDTNRKYFDAKIEARDFAKSSQVVDEINRWVNEETNGTIKEIIQRLRPDEVMALLNAIYFYGPWKYPFDESETQSGSFARPDGSTVDVLFMRQQQRLPYNRADKATIVELPYGDSLFTMTAILPHEGQSAEKLLHNLDRSKWQAWMGPVASQEVDLYIPKFKIRYQKQLKDVLIALGMKTAFSDAANFSRIMDHTNTGTPALSISRVVHRAYVKVNEKGTEASAATAVINKAVSVPPTIRFDRPFVFVIREVSTGTVIFVGKVTDPSL